MTKKNTTVHHQPSSGSHESGAASNATRHGGETLPAVAGGTGAGGSQRRPTSEPSALFHSPRSAPSLTSRTVSIAKHNAPSPRKANQASHSPHPRTPHPNKAAKENTVPTAAAGSRSGGTPHAFPQTALPDKDVVVPMPTHANAPANGGAHEAAKQDGLHTGRMPSAGSHVSVSPAGTSRGARGRGKQPATAAPPNAESSLPSTGNNSGDGGSDARKSRYTPPVQKVSGTPATPSHGSGTSAATLPTKDVGNHPVETPSTSQRKRARAATATDKQTVGESVGDHANRPLAAASSASVAATPPFISTAFAAAQNTSSPATKRRRGARGAVAGSSSLTPDGMGTTLSPPTPSAASGSFTPLAVPSPANTTATGSSGGRNGGGNGPSAEVTTSPWIIDSSNRNGRSSNSRPAANNEVWLPGDNPFLVPYMQECIDAQAGTIARLRTRAVELEDKVQSLNHFVRLNTGATTVFENRFGQPIVDASMDAYAALARTSARHLASLRPSDPYYPVWEFRHALELRIFELAAESYTYRGYAVDGDLRDRSDLIAELPATHIPITAPQLVDIL